MSVKTGTIKLYLLERCWRPRRAACVILRPSFGQSVSQQQEMWPLPALYFLEVIAASLVGLWGIFQDDAPGSLLAWAVAGALVGFAFMGAWSVGFFYLPVAGLLGLAALWQDRQDWRRLPLHLGLALLAAVAQAALMLALIRVLYPNATF